MTTFQYILLGFLVVCAISVSFSRNLLNSILIYMSYSLIMSILWVCLESPDLAITEAAVGAGVTSILFFATLKKIQAIRIESEKTETNAGKDGGTSAQDKQENSTHTMQHISESGMQTENVIMNDSAEDRKAEPAHE